MIKRLRNNISLTLVEVLVAMLILSGSVIGILSSFSYSYKFSLRAARKIEAMNYGRKTQDAYRALWLADQSDLRLATQPDWVNINNISWLAGWLAPGYKGAISVLIKQWQPPDLTKQINVKVSWVEP